MSCSVYFGGAESESQDNLIKMPNSQSNPNYFPLLWFCWVEFFWYFSVSQKNHIDLPLMPSSSSTNVMNESCLMCFQGSGPRCFRGSLWRTGSGNTRGTQPAASGGQGLSLSRAPTVLVFRINAEGRFAFFVLCDRRFLRFALSRMSWTSSWRL